MARVLGPDRRPTSSAYLQRARAQEPAALHHLRQRRRRQEHAHRPAAVRVQDAVRRSARGARGRLEEVGTQGDELDFALLRRRPVGRARAGHHDRRGLPLLLDRQAQVHRRRHARATSSTRATWSPARRPPILRVILVDARKGVLTQTRRHSYPRLAARHPPRRARGQQDGSRGLFARSVSRRSRREYREFATQLGLADVTCIPISALNGDNIVDAQRDMPWYQRPTLMGCSRRVEIDETRAQQRLPLRIPVQWVNRPESGFSRLRRARSSRGVRQAGRSRRVQPSGREARVARIVTSTAICDEAVAGQSITLTLADEIDVSRGDLIVAADAPAEVADQFEATVVWMNEAPLLPGRSYLMKIGTQDRDRDRSRRSSTRSTSNTLEHLAAEKLELNEIGVCNLRARSARSRSIPTPRTATPAASS